MKGILTFVIVAVVLIAGYIAYLLFIKEDTGSEAVAQAFAANYVMKYKEATYGNRAENVHYKLKSWKFHKKHYILDIDADWIGECCGVIDNTRCEVKKNFEVQVRETGKIYSQKVSELNSCASQHVVAGLATELAADAFVLSMELQSDLSDNSEK